MIQNMKRSLKDYLIYIATITMCVGILFAFLSIAFSTSISDLAENMANLQKALIVLSVLLMFVFSFLINYAMKFIIRRRKKEFGTYMLLGLERKIIFKIFLIENIILGFGSFLIGLPLGILLYQILNAMIMHLFDNPYRVVISVSFQAVLLSMLLFFIIYGVSAAKSSRMVARMKIKELIYGGRYNEKPRMKNTKVGLALNILFLIIAIASLFLILNGLTQNSNDAFIRIIIALIGLIVGVYGFHAGFPTLMYFLKNSTAKWRYQGINMFLAGQITSKINSTAKIIASSAIMLTFALILLMAGLSIGATYKSNIEYEAPFDITVAIDSDVVSFKDVLDYIGTETNIKDYVEYKIYRSEETEIKNAPILRLSDYNQLRKLIGLDPKSISDDQFIIHSEAWDVREIIEEKLLQKNELTIDGITLRSNKQYIFDEPFEQARTNGNQGYILVIPDYICNNLESDKSRLVVSTMEPAHQELKNKLTQYVKNDWSPEFNEHSDQRSESKITKFINVKSWSVANGLTGLAILSFGSIYISLILFLIVGTILSLQQSSEDTENRHRFTLLRKLGTKESDILQLMKRQIAIYFALPSIVPIVLTLVIGFLMNRTFRNLILVENTILLYTAITLAIFLVVYSCYMVLSYKIFKWGVLYKKRN